MEQNFFWNFNLWNAQKSKISAVPLEQVLTGAIKSHMEEETDVEQMTDIINEAKKEPVDETVEVAPPRESLGTKAKAK